MLVLHPCCIKAVSLKHKVSMFLILSNEFFRSATIISFLWEGMYYCCCISFCHLAISLSCKQYVEPRPREVCFWVIYHRHPGLPMCLITPGSTKSQSASGPAAWGGGALCVCIGTYTGHIFPSKFNDGIAHRMCFLFKKVKVK